jgi:aryl-alcohol dehydrogenase-like predicted oxidoreductase
MNENVDRRSFLRQSVATVGGVNLLNAELARAGAESDRPADSPVPTTILGRTGTKVSRLGFGAGTPFWQWLPSEQQAARLLEYAVQKGVTYFDTAFSYGKDNASEKRLGKSIVPEYRKQLFLVTKSRERSYDGVMTQFEQSLTNLNTDYLDLYHMHALKTFEDVRTLAGPSGGFKAFRKLKDGGAIKNIGFSFHTWEEFSQQAYKEFDPDVVMFSLNAARDSGCEEHFLPLAREKNTGLVAMKVTAGDSLIGKVSGQDLVRYVFSLPVHVVNIGIGGFGTLESCVELAKEAAISQAEREQINKRLAYEPGLYDIPYRRPGYQDGCFA